MASLLTQGVQTERTLRLKRMRELLGVAEGTTNPWEMKEYGPMVETLKKQRDQTLSQVPDLLQKTGVSGPASALLMEKIANNANDQTLNLVNQMRQGTTEQGLNLAGNMENDYLKWQQIQAALKAQRMQDATSRYGMNSKFWMEALKSAMAAAGAAAGI